MDILLHRVKEKRGCLDKRRRDARESSEDMNKGAGEMDERSRLQQKRDKDGWREAPAERQRAREDREEEGETRARLDKHDK